MDVDDCIFDWRHPFSLDFLWMVPSSGYPSLAVLVPSQSKRASNFPKSALPSILSEYTPCDHVDHTEHCCRRNCQWFVYLLNTQAFIAQRAAFDATLSCFF